MKCWFWAHHWHHSDVKRIVEGCRWTPPDTKPMWMFTCCKCGIVKEMEPNCGG